MLEQHISVWPPVHEHKMMLDKLKVTRRLDAISRDSTPPTVRPRTYTLHEATDVLDKDTIQNELVLKRNSSGNRDHIILPPLEVPLERNIVRQQEKGTLGVHGTWFAQDYVENLKTMGEMRLFITYLKNIECAIATRFTGNTADMEVEEMCKIPFLQDEPQ